MIEELTGRKRRLELRGTGLPFSPAGFGSELAIATQFYPGNKRATQQVLTPKVNPSDWTGMWRTTSLLKVPCVWTDEAGLVQQIGYAHNMWRVFESLLDGGQLLRVTWTNESPVPMQFDGGIGADVPQRKMKIVRIGRLKKFDANPESLDDIGWAASFEWVGKDESESTPLQDVSFDLIAKIQLAITAQDGVVAANNTALKAPPTRLTIGSLEQFVNAPMATFDSFARAADNVTSRLHDIGSLLLTMREIPASLIGRVLDVANYAVSTSNNFMDQMSRTPVESTLNRNRVSMLTRSISYYSSAIKNAQTMAAINADVAQAANRRKSALHVGTSPGARAGTSDIVSVYLPRVGDTFGKIAMKFYGTDTVSDALAKANGLSGYAIAPPVGKPLVIPTRAVLTSLSRSAV